MPRLLNAEFGADGVGDGVGVVGHGGVVFGFDHDAGEGFGAAVTDDDATGSGEGLFGGGDGFGYGRNGIERLLLADFDVDDDLGKGLQVGGEFGEGFASAVHDVEH